MTQASHQDAQQLYGEAMDAAKQVMELTRLMKRRAAKRIAEPMVRSSNSVCNNFLVAWQNRADRRIFLEKLTAAIADARSTRDHLSASADANEMPVEQTRQVVATYDALIVRLTELMEGMGT
jgi:four helix bundle protein